MNNYTDFEPLRLELLRFSKYLVFDEEKEGIRCPIAIQKLQKEKYKDEEGAKKKYVIAFIVSGDKVIRIIKKKLNEFDIELFNDYMYDKKDLRVVVYLFDTRIENKKLQQFLSKVSSLEIRHKFNRLNIKGLGTVVGLLSALFSAMTLYFVYLGLIAYGIIPQYFPGIQEVYFLLFFALLFIIISISLMYVFIPIIAPLILALILIGYFAMEKSIFNILFFTTLFSIAVLVLLYIVNKFKPLFVANLLHEVKNFIPDFILAILMFLNILFFVLMIGIPVLSGIIKPDFSRHWLRSNYEMVGYVYQNMYSGYPKILIDNSQDKNNTYYVPFEAGGYYYVYNVESAKKRYFADLNKTQMQQTLCKRKSLRDDFINTYIIDNPYIKQKYQNKRFSINNKNITIEEFKMRKIISVDDINRSLCDDKME